MTFALDRVCSRRYSAAELYNLHIVLPQLNNLYQNFYYQDTKQVANTQTPMGGDKADAQRD